MRDEFDPVALDVGFDAAPIPEVERAREEDAEKLKDKEFLREHRAKLLASQGLDPRDVDLRKPPKSPRPDFAIAAIYTLYVVPMAFWVFGVAPRGARLVALGIIAVAAVFLVLFWRTYVRAWKRQRRARAYVGTLLEKQRESDNTTFAVTGVFDGGRVELPYKIHRELVPGVRYRVHAPGTDEVAVDVAIDDDEPPRQGAYR